MGVKQMTFQARWYMQETNIRQWAQLPLTLQLNNKYNTFFTKMYITRILILSQTHINK